MSSMETVRLAMLRMEPNDTITIPRQHIEPETLTYEQVWHQQVILWRYRNHNTHSNIVPMWFNEYKGDTTKLLVSILEYELDVDIRTSNSVISDLLGNNIYLSYAGLGE